MTRVTRPLKRESVVKQFSRGKNRPIILEIEPPGRMLRLRLKGERKTYEIPLGEVFFMAVAIQREVNRRTAKPKPSRPRAQR